MLKTFDKAEIFSWMPLTGFDKDAPDKGTDNFIKRMGFIPHGVCQFLFHPDIVHLHNGMKYEKILPPDNCSYHANPYNEERCRQNWTNYDLRDLTQKLNEKGIECFLSIMGTVNNNRFHKEWISDYPELLCNLGDVLYGMNVLKRFKDGSYYEDFFIDKLCQVMVDYGFTGFHVAEDFCPQPGCLVAGDYTFDMIDQFATLTGYLVPKELFTNNDSQEIINARQEWIWRNCRAEWIEFISSRWESFWKKLCNRLHSIGKKVFVLGMYCTDPFATLYTKGIDLRKIARAGVDYLMTNLHANPSLILSNRPWRFYEWANMVSLTDVFAPDCKILNMLSVKDAAEEWDMLHHAPTLLDRDISFLSSYMRYTDNGIKRCLDGHNICLADGIYEDEWKWLRERFEIAFDEIPEKVLTPTLVWSDYAFDNTLIPYIKTRRWTLHKFIYEINKLGAHCSTTVRTEKITNDCGDLFVPNFDLLSEDEKKLIANYKGGAVIGTAALENFCRDDFKCDLYFEDKNSPYPMCAFVFNMNIENKDEILTIAKEDDGGEVIEDVNNVAEVTYSLNQFMPYQKVSSGFLKALAMMIKISYSNLLTSTHPIIPMRMKDGRIRVYAMNDDILHYAKALITVKKDIKNVSNVSKFPLLPVKFSDEGKFDFTTQDYPGGQHTFRLLIPQGGVSIVDIYLEN